MINKNLWHAYTQIRLLLPSSINYGDFVIITAWNPYSIQASEEENRRNNARLQQLLINHEWSHVTVTDLEDNWFEESFAVVMPVADAIILARRFSQNAIYYVQDGVLILQSCLDEQTLDLGAISAKVEWL